MGDQSGLDHTVIRLCGFMQAVISQYAVPILEEKSVYGTDDQTKIAYMDTTDVAKLTLASLKKENCSKVLTFAGPQAFTIQQVIGFIFYNDSYSVHSIEEGLMIGPDNKPMV